MYKKSKSLFLPTFSAREITLDGHSCYDNSASFRQTMSILGLAPPLRTVDSLEIEAKTIEHVSRAFNTDMEPLFKLTSVIPRRLSKS
jgi:hypothetical protein